MESFDIFTTRDLVLQQTDDEPAQFCLPAGIGPDQLKATLVAYMQHQNTDLDVDASLVVLGAIQDAYGCDQ